MWDHRATDESMETGHLQLRESQTQVTRPPYWRTQVPSAGCEENTSKVPVERRSVRMVLTKPTLNLGFQPVTLIKQPHRNCCDSKMRHLIFIHQIKSIIKVLLEPIEPHCIRTTILLSPKGPLKILIDPSKQGHGRKSVDQTKNPTNFTRT